MSSPEPAPIGQAPKATEDLLTERIKWFTLGAVIIIHALLLVSIWGHWARMAGVTAVFLLVTGSNMVLAQRFFSERTRLAEAIRFVLNMMATLVYGHYSDWALPAWLYLPLNSIWVDSRVDPGARRRLYLLLVLTCGLAIADGAPVVMAACFALLSLINFFISEGRVFLTHEALDSLDRQHQELARAHEDLARAHEQLAVAHQVALEQERLSSLGMLAAGMAHEINNPMSYVKSNVNSLLLDLRAQKQLGPELREYVDDVLPATLDGIKRVCAIVADLRRFARGDPEAMAEYDLNAEIEAALRICHSKIQPRCDVVLDLGELPSMLGRPGQITQVMVNLLVNAAQAMPEGGSIYVTTRSDAGAEAVVTVRDTGMGMPPEVRARLFQPFFTTKPVGEGTGLGLAVVHGIVSAHKGRIQVDTQPQQGTTFTVRLPRYPPLDLLPHSAHPLPPLTPLRPRVP
ncbi:ATP-binding protein [Myxococcaceae bacterium GXIMD 01537]